MVRFFFQFVVIVAMHPMWYELNTIVSTLCAVTATDGTTTKRDETRSQRKTTRTPTPYRGTPYVCPSPTNANFDLRRRVNAGASYMLACLLLSSSLLPVVCLLSRCPWSRKTAWIWLLLRKYTVASSHCLCGVCTLAIGNGVWW